MIYLNLDLGPLDTAFDKQFGSALEIQLHSQSANSVHDRRQRPEPVFPNDQLGEIRHECHDWSLWKSRWSVNF